MMPTGWPSLASEMARFTESVVMPTPPLPEPTAMRFLTPGMGSLGGCPGWLGVIRVYRNGSLSQQSGGGLGKVGQHEICSRAADGGQGLEHRAVVVDPAV